jgi:hypothetical protein
MIEPFIEKSTNNDIDRINKLELQNLLTNDKPIVNSDLELKLDDELSVVSSETSSDDDQVINNLSKTITNYIVNEEPINIKLENKEFIKKDEEISVSKAIDNITDTLDINKNNLNSIIQDKKKVKIKKQPILINRLLNNNVRLKKINKYVKKDKELSEKINKLKKKLSILQLNSIIDKEDNEELLNEVIKTIDNKLYNINNVLENNYIQNGGTSSRYYYKYLKYKIKYLELINST